MPASFTRAASGHIIASLSPWMRASVSFLVKALFVSGPVSKAAFVFDTIGLAAFGYFALSIVSTWCFKTMEDEPGNLPAFFGFVGAAISLVGNLCCIAVRVHSEAGRMCAFLDSLHRSVASEKARPSTSG